MATPVLFLGLLPSPWGSGCPSPHFLSKGHDKSLSPSCLQELTAPKYERTGTPGLTRVQQGPPTGAAGLRGAPPFAQRQARQPPPLHSGLLSVGALASVAQFHVCHCGRINRDGRTFRSGSGAWVNFMIGFLRQPVKTAPPGGRGHTTAGGGLTGTGHGFVSKQTESPVSLESGVEPSHETGALSVCGGAQLPEGSGVTAWSALPS